MLGRDNSENFYLYNMSALIIATRQDANYLSFLNALNALADQAMVMVARMGVGTTYLTDMISDYKVTIFLDKGRIYTDYKIKIERNGEPIFETKRSFFKTLGSHCQDIMTFIFH